MPRVTNYYQSQLFLSDLGKVQNRLSDTQRQMSTQRRINAASDDPFGMSQALTFDAQLSDIKAYQRNVTDTLSFISTVDSSLDSAGSALHRIRELVVQASNSTNDQNALNSIAQEIRQLKESLRDQANTRYGDTFAFSGTATDTQPYPLPGNAYAGNNGVINRRVAPGLQVAINLDGPTVFGTTTGPTPAQMGLFDLVDRIVSDLTSGVPADREELRTSCLQSLDDHMNNILQQRATLGSEARRLEVTEQRLGDLEIRLTEARSDVVDADMARTYMDFQNHNTMYQSALAAGARMMQTSLLDFI